MSTLENFLAQIEDQKAVRIELPVRDSAQKKRISCVYTALERPRFSLLFELGQLTPSNIDLQKNCIVTIDQGGQNVSLMAQINEIKDDQVLELTALDVINHEQLRNYFRVDANAPITATPLVPESNQDGRNAGIEGETLDISGSGVLCSFPAPLDQGTNILIMLALPAGSKEVVEIKGFVVRCTEIEKDVYHVAIHFVGLASEDRDKIMGTCFELQRQQLRMKVRVTQVD